MGGHGVCRVHSSGRDTPRLESGDTTLLAAHLLVISAPRPQTVVDPPCPGVQQSEERGVPSWSLTTATGQARLGSGVVLGCVIVPMLLKLTV